jgi:hypothetical protein
VPDCDKPTAFGLGELSRRSKQRDVNGADQVDAQHAGLKRSMGGRRVIMSCCGMVLPAVVRHDRWMTIIKINAIRVPRESGDELAHRFAARAGAR